MSFEYANNVFNENFKIWGHFYLLCQNYHFMCIVHILYLEEQKISLYRANRSDH